MRWPWHHDRDLGEEDGEDGGRGEDGEDGAAADDESEGLLPDHDRQEMVHAWWRTLTVMGERHGPDEAIELLRQVNTATAVTVTLQTPLSHADAEAVEASVRWLQERAGIQAGINILVEARLIGWLMQATGQSWSEIVQHLARDLPGLTGLPSQTPPPQTPP